MLNDAIFTITAIAFSDPAAGSIASQALQKALQLLFLLLGRLQRHLLLPLQAIRLGGVLGARSKASHFALGIPNIHGFIWGLYEGDIEYEDYMRV